jgi:hypothetical protein
VSVESQGRSPYLTPAAVLAGALVIALVVRTGFHELAEARRIPTPLPTPAAPAVTLPLASSTVSEAPAERLEAERLERDRAASVRDKVANAFGDQTKLYKAACPIKGAELNPMLMPHLELAFTIGADGVETHRDVHALRADPKLVTCLRGVTAPRLRIDPPGRESQATLLLVLL